MGRVERGAREWVDRPADRRPYKYIPRLGVSLVARHVVARQLALDFLIGQVPRISTPRSRVVEHLRRLWVGGIRHALLERNLVRVALATVRSGRIALIRKEADRLLARVQRAHGFAACSYGICVPQRRHLVVSCTQGLPEAARKSDDWQWPFYYSRLL